MVITFTQLVGNGHERHLVDAIGTLDQHYVHHSSKWGLSNLNHRSHCTMALEWNQNYNIIIWCLQKYTDNVFMVPTTSGCAPDQCFPHHSPFPTVLHSITLQVWGLCKLVCSIEATFQYIH